MKHAERSSLHFMLGKDNKIVKLNNKKNHLIQF